MCDHCEHDDFVWECEVLIEECDMLSDEKPQARDFLDSVREKVQGMMKWAKDNKHRTPKMKTALENMNSGVDRWRS